MASGKPQFFVADGFLWLRWLFVVKEWSRRNGFLSGSVVVVFSGRLMESRLFGSTSL